MLSFKLTSASDEIVRRLDLVHSLIISWYMGTIYIRHDRELSLTILELRVSYQRLPKCCV